MIDLHLVEHHPLAAHHVVVVVGREVHAHAVGGLGALAVADVVGQDDEVLLDVEHAARHEQHIGEDGIQQRVRIAARAVQQQDGVIHMTGCIAMRRAQREVVQLEFRKRLAGTEAEVRQGNGAVLRRPVGLPVLPEPRGAGTRRPRRNSSNAAKAERAAGENMDDLRGYGLSVTAEVTARKWSQVDVHLCEPSGLCFQPYRRRDKILASGMCCDFHLPAQPPLRRFRRGRHDRGR